MVLHRSASSSASRTLKVCGVVVAYAFALVTGTAVLIAAIGSGDSTQAQATAVSGAQSADAFLLASRTIPNDKRGF